MTILPQNLAYANYTLKKLSCYLYGEGLLKQVKSVLVDGATTSQGILCKIYRFPVEFYRIYIEVGLQVRTNNKNSSKTHQKALC